MQATNIAVLEPSQIVFEGLSGLLTRSGQYFKILRIDSLDEISNLNHADQPVAVIINPSMLQNKAKEFSAVKKNLPAIRWAGLVYSYYDKQLLSLFDEIINITDTPRTILHLINAMTDRENPVPEAIEHEQLSDREIEVLKLIVSGLSNKEIADKLFISIHTVVSHRKNISQKTGIKSQAGLTIYAISNKIINLDDF